MKITIELTVKGADDTEAGDYADEIADTIVEAIPEEVFWNMTIENEEGEEEEVEASGQVEIVRCEIG